MGDKQLQLRTDTLLAFDDPDLLPKKSEPLYIEGERRLLMGRNDRGRMGAPLMGNPLREGVQHKVLWAAGRWGNEPGAKIPAYGSANAYDLSKGVAFTGGCMEDELLDSAGVEIWADGYMIPDSPDMRLMWDLTFGPDLPGPSALTPPGGPVEISYRRTGANCLGFDYQEVIGWHLHIFVHFLGYDGKGRFAAGGAEGRVRVTAEMRWGPMQDAGGSLGSSVGPVENGASASWRPNADYAEGAKLVHGRHAVRAIGPVTGAAAATASSSTADRLAWLESREAIRDDREPGGGNRWREWWYERRQALEVRWESPADLRGLGNSLSLRFAGPYQSDTGLSVTTWNGAGAGDWDPQASDDLDRVVIDGAGFYTPRFKFAKTGAPQPSISPRHWRQLSYFRRDELVCNSSVAVMHGGRVGLADRRVM